MRYVLSVCLALTGCAFYQPDLTDCVLPCGEASQCPQGLTCVANLCRPPGKTTACQCTVGKTRPCGSNVGVCQQGYQECTREGTWGACTGSVEPSPETCDGRDNDCDGFTDYVPGKLVVEDRNPYTTYETTLLGTDGGYALLYDGLLPDGGPGLMLKRFDPHLAELDLTLVRNADFQRSRTRLFGDLVVTALNIDDEIQVVATPTAMGGQPVQLGRFPVAHYDSRLQLEVMPEGARAAWVTTAYEVQLFDVPWDGGAAKLSTVAPVIDGGPLTDFVLTTDGRFSLYQVPQDMPDGGTEYLNVLQNNATKEVLRTDVGTTFAQGYDFPFMRRARQHLHSDGDRVAYMTDWTDGTSRRVTYCYNLAISDSSYEVLPAGEATWGESDTLLLPNGDLLAAISNIKQQSIVLASIHGTHFANLEIVLRNLPDNSGFGIPSVARSGDEMVGLVWVTAKGIMARRVCPPHVGD